MSDPGNDKNQWQKEIGEPGSPSKAPCCARRLTFVRVFVNLIAVPYSSTHHPPAWLEAPDHPRPPQMCSWVRRRVSRPAYLGPVVNVSNGTNSCSAEILWYEPSRARICPQASSDTCLRSSAQYPSHSIDSGSSGWQIHGACIRTRLG